MKIAYDAKRFFHNSSGLGNYSRDLVRILAQYFPDNAYLLLDKNKTDRGAELLKFPNVDFLKTPGGTLSRQLNAGIAAQDAGAAIFHGLSGELPLKWDKKGIKKIVTIHDLIFMRFPDYYSFFDRKIHYWKFKNAAERADIVVAISEQTKQDIIKFLHIPESKIRVVYQGCHEVFKKDPTIEFQNSVREKYTLPERFVLNVGTIEERKNLLNVLIALKDTQIPLIVVGKKQKKYFAKLQNYLSKNKVDVRFLDDVSMQELAVLYRLADVFVYPSLFEGFGIPVIESLFSETPVITSNRSSLPEAGGPDSLYIDPKNTADIRAEILHLWESESERKRRAEKGKAFVQKFSDAVVAEEMMKVYQEVL